MELLKVPNFLNLDGLVCGFTTRKGGKSSPPFDSLNLGFATGDDDDVVSANYDLLAQALGTESERIVGVRQVHGDLIHRVDSANDLSSFWVEDGDGLITNKIQIFLTIRVADCFPILAVDPTTHTIGAAHAGWRGTLAKIGPKLIQAMQNEYEVNPKNVRVAIGPGISMKHFNVSAGIGALFAAQVGAKGKEIRDEETHAYLDLDAINQRLLREAGVPAENIFSLQRCTYEDEESFYSYRRDGKMTGRTLGVIGWTR